MKTFGRRGRGVVVARGAGHGPGRRPAATRYSKPWTASFDRSDVGFRRRPIQPEGTVGLWVRSPV